MCIINDLKQVTQPVSIKDGNLFVICIFADGIFFLCINTNTTYTYFNMSTIPKLCAHLMKKKHGILFLVLFYLFSFPFLSFHLNSNIKIPKHNMFAHIQLSTSPNIKFDLMYTHCMEMSKSKSSSCYNVSR